MKKTPKLRFKGFEGEWEEKKLGETLLVNSGKDYKHLKEGNIPVYGTGGYMLSVNESLSSVDAIGIGRKGTIDKPQYLKAPFWTVDTLFFLTTKNKDDLKFLYNLTQNIKWKDLDESTGVPSLSKSNINVVNITIPSLPEQHHIASYFTHLDTLIEASRQKVEKYKQVKAASLQALFPQHGERVPKLRFKGYEGEWKKVELGEIGTFLKGQGYSKADITDKGTPLFLYGRLYTNYSFVTTSVDTFANKQEGSVISEGNEIIIPASGETAEDIVRASAILSKGIILGGDLNIIRIDTNIYDPAFVALSISYGSTHNELSKSAQGKTVVHLHNSEIKKGVIKIPSLQEQHLIAQYFTNLDSLLTLEQLRYEKLQQVKRASLSQMFA